MAVEREAFLTQERGIFLGRNWNGLGVTVLVYHHQLQLMWRAPTIAATNMLYTLIL